MPAQLAAAQFLDNEIMASSGTLIMGIEKSKWQVRTHTATMTQATVPASAATP
jgi:hypothetical protein